jgi:hypothetical protein
VSGLPSTIPHLTVASSVFVKAILEHPRQFRIGNIFFHVHDGCFACFTYELPPIARWTPGHEIHHLSRAFRNAHGSHQAIPSRLRLAQVVQQIIKKDRRKCDTNTRVLHEGSAAVFTTAPA